MDFELTKFILTLRKTNGIGNQSLIKIINFINSEGESLKSNLLNPGKLSLFKNLIEEKPYAELLTNFEKNIKLVEKDIEWCNKNNVKIINILDEEYPESLKSIYNSPVILFILGNLEYNYQRSIGIVGTRKFTAYGKFQCEKFTSELIDNNYTIVSGLAFGVDSITHTKATEKDGKCIAVIGSGLANIYPEVNINLAKKIVEKNGCVVSEYDPFSPAQPVNFPIRNRIIAGLSKSLLVVEADQKSGSLITARFAFDEGREVFAIPADVTRNGSSGCNYIIRKNIAKLVTNPEDLLEDLGTDTKVTTEIEINYLTTDQRKIIDLLSFEKLNSDELSIKTGFEISRLNAELTELELYNLISVDEQNKYFRI